MTTLDPDAPKRVTTWHGTIFQSESEFVAALNDRVTDLQLLNLRQANELRRLNEAHARLRKRCKALRAAPGRAQGWDDHRREVAETLDEVGAPEGENEHERIVALANRAAPPGQDAPPPDVRDLLLRARQFVVDSACDEDDTDVWNARAALLREIDRATLTDSEGR